MAIVVAGIHTPPLQLTKIDQGMYVTKNHFTLQCIILLALFCFYVVYKYGVFYMFDIADSAREFTQSGFYNFSK